MTSASFKRLLAKLSSLTRGQRAQLLDLLDLLRDLPMHFAGWEVRMHERSVYPARTIR